MKQLNQLALMYRYLGDGDGDGILGLMEEAMGTEHLINHNHTFIFIKLQTVRECQSHLLLGLHKM